MTEEQEKHLANLATEFVKQVSVKYEKGAKEHGGNLWEMPIPELIQNTREEIIDAWVYTYTLEKKVATLLKEIQTLKQQISKL